MGGNIRDGITGLGGQVMSKPREFAHLIKNKFGSADNINQLSSSKCTYTIWFFTWLFCVLSLILCLFFFFFKLPKMIIHFEMVLGERVWGNLF